MLSLFSHQEKQIEDARKSFAAGNKHVLLQAATGSGKSIMSTHIIKGAVSKGLKCWFSVPREQLLTQMSNTFSLFDIDHSYISAGMYHNPNMPAQVCTLQTLVKKIGRTGKPDIIVIDEVHWGGQSVDSLIQYARENNIFVLGLTATPARSDNFGMGDWFDNMVTGPSIRWLIDNKFLSRYKLVRPDEIVKRGNQVTHHVETWEKYARDLKTIVYARDVVHSKAIVRDFNKAGYKFAHMDANTPSDERTKIINDLASGELNGISNVFLLTFGFDLAAQVGRSVNVRCILDLAPTESLTAQMQKNGRALRYDQAGDAVIIDLAGNSMPDAHGFPCSERNWILDKDDVHKRDVESREKTLRTMHCKSCLMPSMVGPLNCPHCGTPFIADGKKIRIIDGKLVEFSLDELRQEEDAQKIEARKEQGKAKSKQDLIRVGMARGMTRWNAERWAEHVIKGRDAKKQK
jgi:DNA repair protein RadD